MPIKGVNLVRRIIHADQPKIKILPEESAISFEYDSYKIYSRLIEANYPDYEAVIPYDNSKLIDIEVEPLIKAIQRVSLLASEDNFKIIFNFSKTNLKFTPRILTRDRLKKSWKSRMISKNSRLVLTINI